MTEALTTQDRAVQPGIYYDMPFAEYQQIRALSNSGMKSLAVSPLRYWFDYLDPREREPEEETPALRMGHALHCAVLESEQAFSDRYACALDASLWPVCLDTIGELRTWIEAHGEKPKGVRKDDVIQHAQRIMHITGEYVPILAEEERRFYAANEGKTILKPDEWTRVQGMTLALAEEPALKPILAQGNAEVSIVARDPETGVLLKARLDWMAPKHTLDLKTFTQKRGTSIEKSIGDAIYYERYNVQAYFYDYVRRLATGEAHGAVDFTIAFVESDLPNEVRLKALRPKFAGGVNVYWERARIEATDHIRMYANCLKHFGDKPWKFQQDIDSLVDEDVKQFIFQ